MRSRRPSASSRATSLLRLVGVSDTEDHALDDRDRLPGTQGPFLGVRLAPGDVVADVAAGRAVRKGELHHLFVGDLLLIPDVRLAVDNDVKRDPMRVLALLGR